MSRIIKAALAVMTFASLATPVAAQSYYSSYYNSYKPSDAAFLGVFGAVYVVIICVALVFALAFYLFNSYQTSRILEKNGLGENKAMAYVPFANYYYLAKAAGEDQNAMVYALSPLAVLIGIVFLIIPCLGIFIYFASIILFFVARIILWMRVAKKMGKDEVYGLLVQVANFVPLVGYFISAYMIKTIADSTPVVGTAQPTPVAA